MSNCEYNTMLGPYMDGELGDAGAGRVDAHLLDCAQCRDELRQLRAMSGVFAGAEQPVLSVAALRNVHDRMTGLMEEAANVEVESERIGRRILRISRVLTGIAACLLIAGSLWLSRARTGDPTVSRSNIPEALATWEVPAVTLQPDLSATATASSADVSSSDLLVGGLVADEMTSQ